MINVSGPLATKFWWQNAFLGGSVNAANTWAANQIYNEDKSVEDAFWLGAIATGAGTWLRPRATNIASGMLPSHIGGPPPNPNLGSLLQKPGRPNPVPAIIGKGVEDVVSNIPSFINITEEGKRK